MATPSRAAVTNLQTDPVNGQLFAPAEAQDKFIVTEEPDTLGHLRFSTGTFVDYANRPISGRVPGFQERKLLKDVTTVDLLGAVGVLDRYQFNVDLPLNPYANSVKIASGADTSGASIGDLRLKAKVHVLNVRRFPIGLSLAGTASLPTGNAGEFLGGNSLVGGLLAIADLKIPSADLPGPIVLGSNLGVQLRKRAVTPQAVIGNGANYNLALNVPLPSGIEAIADLFGQTSFDQFLRHIEANPLELELAVRYRFPGGFVVTGGGGRGLTHGIGSPAFRLFAGLTYRFQRRLQDRDHDGIPDAADACPDEPEDLDGYQDDDGCPEAPAVLIARVFDAVRYAPLPAFAAYQATAAVSPSAESAPAETTAPPPWSRLPGPNSEIHFESKTGGVFGFRVTAPHFDVYETTVRMQPGITQQIEIDLTRSNRPATLDLTISDGITGSPVTAQVLRLTDAGRFALVGVGAHQTIVAATDGTALFNLQVTANGYAMTSLTYAVEAGETLDAQAVLAKKKTLIVGNKLVLDPIYFVTGTSILQPESFSVLDTVYDFLRANPGVTMSIEGHTDAQGSRTKNMKLSANRALTAKRYLVERGISEARLTDQGWGPDKPIATNKTEAGRQMNRRVEFLIHGKLGEGESDAAVTETTPAPATAPPAR